MPSRPTVWLCLPVPIWPNTYGINSTIMQNEVIPVIRQVATEKSLAVIDLNAPMQPFQAYFSDGVHPNNAGQDSIAHWIYRVLRTAPVALNPAPERGFGLFRSSAKWLRIFSLDGRKVSRERKAAGTYALPASY